MEQQACNPYLPQWEYVPDGEPHVFDGRIYIFGSHDRFGGNFYCEKDYTVWSAPVDDLSRWRCEGVSYKSTFSRGLYGHWSVCTPSASVFLVPSGRTASQLVPAGTSTVSTKRSPSILQ